MIKVPATVEGIRAVEALTADGINVSITLMFSLEHYEAVAQAYLQGIDRHGSAQGRVGRLGIRQPPRSGRGSAARGRSGSPEALALRGTIAIANAKRVYRRFREIFDGEAFAALKRRGARPAAALVG